MQQSSEKTNNTRRVVQYLFVTLKAFGLTLSVASLLRTMYAGIRSTLLQYGGDSEKFSGIHTPRQSCPPTPVLLVLDLATFFEVVLRCPKGVFPSNK